MNRIGMLSFACLIAASLSDAGEQELTIRGEANVELTSSYVWRGEVINDEACFQPFVSFEANDASLKFWGTWDLRHTSESSARTRTEITLDYMVKRDMHIFRPGLIAYIYQDDYLARARDTFEIFLEYALDIPYGRSQQLIPSLAINYNIADVGGMYAAFKLEHSTELVRDKLDFDVYLNVGWGDKDYVNAKFSLPKYVEEEDRTFEPDKATFLDLTLVAALPMLMNEQLTVTPAVKYARVLDSEIRDALDDADEKYKDFGGSLTVTLFF